MTYVTYLLVAATLLAGPPNADPGTEAPVDWAEYVACGPTSLYVVCQLKGVDLEWEPFIRLFHAPSRDGTHSFADLSAVARQFGLQPRD